jgi:hypothetical protein
VSKRLHVLMSDAEYEDLQRAAFSQKLGVGAFVRRELQRSCQRSNARAVDDKLRVIQSAMAYSFPTADLEQMNQEIEQGYRTGLA